MEKTTVHHLTNGATNFTFRVSGPNATLISMDVDSWSAPKVETMEREKAQKFYASALKFGCKPGFTRHYAVRKLTTLAQVEEYFSKVYDHEKYDNDAESELADREQFYDVGYLEVPA